MTRPRMLFCYRYGLLGGISAQLLNRFPYLSRHFDVSILYQQDRGMVGRFPPGRARAAATEEERVAAIRELAPDLAVVIDSPTFVEAWRSAGAPGKLVLEVHTTTSNASYLRQRDLFSEVSHFITVSSYMEGLLRQLELHLLAPITVVPNCLEHRWREPAETPPFDGVPVLWVGKLDGHKRWRTATDIAGELAESDDRVVPVFIGGMTAPEPEINAFTTKLSTAAGLSRAVWYPWMEYDRMRSLYATVGRAGGVHLCTTVNESFGMAVAESLIQGCPVVAPAVGALPELLPTQALYRAGDWADARTKLHRAITDTGYRASLLETVDEVRRLTAPETTVEAYLGVASAVLGHVELIGSQGG